MQLLRTCATWKLDTVGFRDPVAATRIALKSMARRILDLGDEIAELDELIGKLVPELAPRLVAATGIGVETAGQLLVTAGDNPQRLRSEAAFAMLCGAAPLPASSGKTQRHRLNRGGDRQANSAPHLIVVTACGSTSAPRTTWLAAPPRAISRWRSSAASNASSPVRSTTCSRRPARQPSALRLLDKQESIQGCQPRFKGCRRNIGLLSGV
jgi:transposase